LEQTAIACDGRMKKRRPIMEFDNTVNAPDTHLVTTRPPLLRGAILMAIAAGVAATFALSVPRRVIAQDAQDEGLGHGRRCSNATLRGAYGRLGSGINAIGPGQTEAFVTTGLRTYDGEGGFTDISSFHGALSGAHRDIQATGTYEVHDDCTGTAMFNLPGVPFPIETSFVIVDQGQEVKHAVMSPQPQLATAVERRR
jgi:hypothetical protein